MKMSDNQRTALAIGIAFFTMFVGYFLAYRLYTVVMR